jgi:hypothetical protein
MSLASGTSRRVKHYAGSRSASTTLLRIDTFNTNGCRRNSPAGGRRSAESLSGSMMTSGTPAHAAHAGAPAPSGGSYRWHPLGRAAASGCPAAGPAAGAGAWWHHGCVENAVAAAPEPAQ